MASAALGAKSRELGETMKLGRLSGMHIYGNPDHSALYLKAANPGRFYAGGYAPWSFEAGSWKGVDWGGYVESLIGLGYDGIGEMGAKPVTRDKHTPLDSPAYEGLWEACEDNRFPVVCHVGDPEEFWSEERTPGWAKARGWGYFRGDYPTQGELYAEVENVLTRHPGVQVVFPHMLFLSPHIETLALQITPTPTWTLPPASSSSTRLAGGAGSGGGFSLATPTGYSSAPT